MQLEFTLSFFENQWKCQNSMVQFSAESLDEIDNHIFDFISSTYQKGNFEIDILFDFNSFPQWYRQYMPHYFNRKLTYNLP
jgi:hypothetical protein